MFNNKYKTTTTTTSALSAIDIERVAAAWILVFLCWKFWFETAIYEFFFFFYILYLLDNDFKSNLEIVTQTKSILIALRELHSYTL